MASVMLVDLDILFCVVHHCVTISLCLFTIYQRHPKSIIIVQLQSVVIGFIDSFYLIYTGCMHNIETQIFHLC